MTHAESTRIRPILGPTQETLLIPLLGRALETRRGGRMLRDDFAVWMVDNLDYDFAKWEGGPSMFGACLRTRMFDDHVRRFLQEHPAGTVVQVGTGLNTSFERLDNGAVRWFDLDLPDVIALRHQFFEDTPRRTMLALSALDPAWLDIVRATGGPWCVVAESSIIYLDEADVRGLVVRLAGELPGAWFLTDTTPRSMVESQHRHDAMRHLPPTSWFRWICDDPRSLESWHPNIRLLSSQSFLDVRSELVDAMPWKFRLIVRYAPWLLRSKVGDYRINLYQFAR